MTLSGSVDRLTELDGLGAQRRASAHLLDHFETRIRAQQSCIGAPAPHVGQILSLPTHPDDRVKLAPLHRKHVSANRLRSVALRASFSQSLSFSDSLPASSSGARPRTPGALSQTGVCCHWDSQTQMVPCPCYTKPSVFQGTLARSRSTGSLTKSVTPSAPSKETRDYIQVALLPEKRLLRALHHKNPFESEDRPNSRGRKEHITVKIPQAACRPHSSPGLQQQDSPAHPGAPPSAPEMPEMPEESVTQEPHFWGRGFTAKKKQKSLLPLPPSPRHIHSGPLSLVLLGVSTGVKAPQDHRKAKKVENQAEGSSGAAPAAPTAAPFAKTPSSFADEKNVVGMLRMSCAAPREKSPIEESSQSEEVFSQTGLE